MKLQGLKYFLILWEINFLKEGNTKVKSTYFSFESLRCLELMSVRSEMS